VYLREQLDQSFKTGEELSEAVGMPVLAMIPHQPLLKRVQPLKTSPVVRGNHKLPQRSGLLVQKASPALLQYMVGIQDPSSATVEQFRILHTCLEQAHKAKGWKVFCVTSAVKGEGKTFTTMNLAMTIARDFGKKALLMDMDCKGTILQKLVDRDDQVHPGWANVVQQKSSLHEALVSFNSDKLTLLPIGKVNAPSSNLIALLESSPLLEELRAEYDYILMDAPPVLPLADMRLLENLADGIVLVVRSEETTRDLELKASASLSREKIVGLVFNGVKRPSKPYYYYESSDMAKKI
jgi:capsular exopolysaccharide synthesis family protein